MNLSDWLLIDTRMGTKAEDDFITERDTLAEDLRAVYSGASSTNGKVYKKAQVALQKNKDITFTNEEIDPLLPMELKRCK